MAGSFPRLDPAGTRETFARSFSLTDSETGDAIALTDVTAIVFEIQNPVDQSVALSAEIGDGIALGDDDDGNAIFTVRFEADDMGGLSPKTYDIRCIITTEAAGVETDAEILGTLPVVE